MTEAGKRLISAAKKAAEIEPTEPPMNAAIEECLAMSGDDQEGRNMTLQA
ncbi:MAG: hypothetical protein AAF700_14980 [Pseudomonadota bacterium]